MPEPTSPEQRDVGFLKQDITIGKQCQERKNPVMNNEFKLVSRAHADGKGCDLQFLSEEQARKVRSFHQSFPMYEPTPLVRLSETAKVAQD